MFVRCPWLVVLLLIIPLLISGCISVKQPAVTLTYYTLDYAPPKIDSGPVKATIALGRFRAAPPYAGTRIIYQDSTLQTNHYAYHRWQAPPGDMVAGMFRRDLQSCGLFGPITHHDSALRADYLIEADIDEFLEKDGDTWQASLRLTITLLRQETQKVVPVMQHSYEAMEPCSKKNPRALAQAMSLALATISAEVIRDTHQAIAKDSSSLKNR